MLVVSSAPFLFFFPYSVGDQSRELSYQMQYFQMEEHLTSNTSIVKQKWSYSQAYSLLPHILYSFIRFIHSFAIDREITLNILPHRKQMV